MSIYGSVIKSSVWPAVNISKNSFNSCILSLLTNQMTIPFNKLPCFFSPTKTNHGCAQWFGKWICTVKNSEYISTPILNSKSYSAKMLASLVSIHLICGQFKRFWSKLIVTNSERVLDSYCRSVALMDRLINFEGVPYVLLDVSLLIRLSPWLINWFSGYWWKYALVFL